jgi:phosphoribosylformylglycinamidine synthase
MTAKIRPDALLFGETQSRALVSMPESNLKEFEKIADKKYVSFRLLGRVKGDRLKFKLGRDTLIDMETRLLYEGWKNALSRKIAEKPLI